MENQIQFETWKNQVEDITPQEQIDCLRIIELNISNICNLKCPFCPQSKDWNPSRDFMSLDTVIEISKQLKDFNYQGYICIAGFGEPSMNKNLLNILKVLKDFHLVLVTNGSLNKEELEEISSLAQIKVSVHNIKQIDFFKEKFKNTNAWFRNHDIVNPEMNIYNRGGYLWKPKERIIRPCNFPFYKLFIDVDGYYLRCEADWSHRSKKINNIFNTPIKKFFVEELEEDRKLMLSPEGRQSFSSCKDCDIQGTLTGQKFIDFWKGNHNG